MFLVCNADAIDVVLLSFVATPWIVGPAAVAALLVWCARTKGIAWLFVSAEAAMIVSTVVSEIVLFLKPDAQNGLSTLIFPIFQLAALQIFACVALGLIWLSRRALVA